MLTALLIGFPLLAALLVFFTRGNAARGLALTAAIVEFVISLFALYTYKQDPGSALLSCDCVWIASLGIHFSVALDGLSILLVMLTTFLVPLIILTS